MKLHSVCLAVLALACGCKGKEPTSSPPAGSAGSGGEAKKPETAPVAGAVKLPAGAPFGCFAWSVSEKAVACVLGDRGTASTEVSLALLGEKPQLLHLAKSEGAGAAPVPIADAHIKAANDALASGGYAPIPGESKPLAAGASLDLGQGVSLTFTEKQTSPGGDNQPPTLSHKVTAKCAAGEQTVLEDTTEGAETSVTVRALGEYALVEQETHIAREGEIADSYAAAVIALGTCKVIAPPAM
jgi:hypothetical protein